LFESFLRASDIIEVVTAMNKYVIFLIGIIAIIIGILTLLPSPYGLEWYKQLIDLIKGGIGLLLIIGGIVAIFLGKD
jgi:hypothetical protein